MAQILQDGSILMADGGQVFADMPVIVGDLCELTELLCPQKQGGSGGAGFGGAGGAGARGKTGPQGVAGAVGPQGPTGSGEGGGWTDDGAVVRLTTATDQVAIGAAVPFGTEKLLVIGDVLTTGGQVLVDDGTALVPTYSFSDDSNTGMFLSGSNTIGFSAGGTEVLTVAPTEVTVTGKLTVTGSFDPTDITMSGAGTAHWMQWGSGSTAPVSSGLGTARIRYNETLSQFEQSLDGTLYVAFGGVTFPLQAPDGTVALPSYSFTSDTGGGMYYEPGALTGGGGVAFAAEGIYTFGVSAKFGVTTTQILAADGTVANPLYSFSNAIDSGMFLSGVNPAIAATGGEVVQFSNTGPLQILASSDGTAAAPSFSFVSDSATGMFRGAGGELGLSAGGTEMLRLDGLGQQVLLGIDGTTSNPALSFVSNPNSGLYSPGVGILGFIVGVTEIGRFDATNMQFLHGNAGSAAFPSYSFTTDPTTGMFLDGSGDLGFSAGGTEVLTVAPAGAIVTVDRGYRATSQISSAGASIATMTNAPVAGNPAFWLRVNINGVDHSIPAWLG